MTETDSSHPQSGFPASRAALIACAITLFLFVFRPFGLSIDNKAEAVIVFGFAPLNFIAIMSVHAFLQHIQRWHAPLGATIIIAANLGYLVFWSSSAAIVSLTMQVLLVAALTIGAVAMWNRLRALNQEVIELKDRQTHGTLGDDLIVLKGDGENEIVRLKSDALRYVKAQGNYVEVSFDQAGEQKIVTLRATLAGIQDQAGEFILRRSHRSFLVNLNAVHRLISDRRGMRLDYGDGHVVPVSRSYREAIRSAVQQ
ncbi:MAG: LytTR family DNA-binding domain-containing protein [Pseudomonadota bacterium]